MSSQPPPRRKPRGKPLPLTEDALDKAATVTAADVAEADAWWRRGQGRKPIADLLRTSDDEA